MLDVVVVGAGPSGSTAAYLLARGGLKVALVEKARLPRRKVCGGGLTPKTVALLRELDLLDEEVLVNDCGMLRVFYKGKHQFDIDGARLFITLREVFDYSLAKRAVEAGAALFEGTRVAGVKELRERVEVVAEDGSTLPAEVVIGADGASSVVARALGRKWRREDLSIAVAALVSTQEGARGDVCELHFGAVRYGYCWAFPVSGAGRLFNVGCGTVLEHSKLLLGAFQSFASRFNPSSRPSVAAHLVPTPSKFEREFFGARRVLLVGDAAGLVDPWFGEGIYYAIRSAVYASQAVLDGWSGGNVLDAYYSFLAERILPDLKCARVFRRVFYLRVEAMLRIIRGSRRLKRALIELLNGSIRYRDLPNYLTPRLGMLLRLCG